jgi:hypothetical protein
VFLRKFKFVLEKDDPTVLFRFFPLFLEVFVDLPFLLKTVIWEAIEIDFLVFFKNLLGYVLSDTGMVSLESFLNG